MKNHISLEEWNIEMRRIGDTILQHIKFVIYRSRDHITARALHWENGKLGKAKAANGSDNNQQPNETEAFRIGY